MAKKLTLYSAFLVFALSLSYLESFINLAFIAPGLKLGLANLAVVYLIYKNHNFGAVLVNLARIILSALLFSGINTLIYSFLGAALSLIIMLILKRTKLSIITVSAIGACFHNIGQLIAALLFFPKSILLYLPVLIIGGAILGGIMGSITNVLVKRIKL